MAAKTSFPPSQLFYVGAQTIAGKVVIGATGAVGATSLKGVSSVVRDGVGQYTLTLADSWANLVWAGFTLLHTSGTNCYVQLEADNVASATPTVVIQAYDLDDDTAEEIPDGATLFIKLDVAGSTLGIA